MTIQALSPRLRWLVWYSGFRGKVATGAVAVFADPFHAEHHLAECQRDEIDPAVRYHLTDLDEDPSFQRSFTATVRS